jgi:hypothetical protein
MDILAHRGLWKKQEQKNSLKALTAAISSGFGIETDVRDLDGELVVSHDLPRKGCLSLEKFLSEAEKLEGFRNAVYALNIKSDGLDKELARILKDYKLERNAFFFDMSNPTLYHFSKQFGKENLCTRLSDIEPEPAMTSSCGWIWIDCFKNDWSDWDRLSNFRHKLAFVSPDLHQRAPERFWGELKKFTAKQDNVYLCTDLPEKAKERFG